jgi:hypothetical protein
MTDRGFWVARVRLGGNVRRLMYQPLIWLGILSDDPRRLGAAADSEDLERLTDSLVDGVRGDSKLGRDFLGAKVLVHQPEAIELTRGQPPHAFSHGIVRCTLRSRPITVRQAARFYQANPHLAQYSATPEQRVFA